MAGLTSKKMDDPLGMGTGNCIVNSSVVVTVPVVTVNIFFDGTGNNKENTALRLKIDNYLQELNRLNSEIEEKESLEKELYMRSRTLSKGSNPQLDEEILGLRKELHALSSERQALKEEKEISEALEKETSYNNDFTNVALLEMATKRTPVPPIYIEGAGTTKYEKDDSAGLGMAKGRSGVVKRVEEVFIKLNKLVETKYCSKGRYKVDLARVLPDKEDRQHLYNNYIFNSLMPVNFKLRGRAKGGLDRNEEAAYFAGVANEGHDNNQGLNGNPIRIEVSGG